MSESMRDQFVRMLREEVPALHYDKVWIDEAADLVSKDVRTCFDSIAGQDRADRAKHAAPGRLNVLTLSIAALWGRR